MPNKSGTIYNSETSTTLGKGRTTYYQGKNGKLHSQRDCKSALQLAKLKDASLHQTKSTMLQCSFLFF